MIYIGIVFLFSLYAVKAANLEYDIQLHLPAVNPTLLKSHVQNISNPLHPSYQQFLTQEQVQDIVVNKQHIKHIKHWLEHLHGVKNYTILNQQSFTIHLDNRTHVENMFHVSLKSPDYRYSSITPRVKNHTIHSYVQLITGLQEFTTLKVRTQPQINGPTFGNSPLVSADNIASFYKMPKPSTLPIRPVSAVIMGIAGYDQPFFSLNDVQQFLASSNGPSNMNGFVPNITYVGGNNDQSNIGLEASADVQCVLSLNPYVQLTYWYNSNADWPNFFAQLLGLPDDQIPGVVTMSYATAEINENGAQSILAYVDQQAMQLGIRGVTIFSSSGDDGAPGSFNDYCDDYSQYGFQYPLFVEFPASIAHIMAVGGTKWLYNGTQVYAEAAVTGVSSGGGYSGFFTPTSQQQANIQANYFNVVNPNQLPPPNYYLPANRGLPDISMVAQDFTIVQRGGFHQVAGTSLSSPFMASFVTRLNEVSMNWTGKTLGYINTLLYTIASDSRYANIAFSNVSIGNNICTLRGCSPDGIPCVGFVAANSWNPVVGLGTPLFDGIKSYLVNEIWSKIQSSSSTGGYNFSSSSSSSSTGGYNFSSSSSSSTGGYNFSSSSCQSRFIYT